MDLLAQAAEGFRGIPVDEALKQQALKFLGQWLTEPEFAAYRPQIEWLVQREQWPGLLDRFYQILPFGTGGRRGAVGIGPNRMNLWTLAASVQGHCEYLKERFPGVENLRVVLAYDVRRFEDKRKNYNPDLANPVLHLSSRDLAHHAAGVYAANGIQPFILPPDSTHYLATPELSFTIRRLGAHGGLNISASHNPPDDNGGKFYDERGGQPVPPEDQIMADLVDQVQAIKRLSWADVLRSGRVRLLDDGPHRAYIDLCRKQSLIPPPRFDEIKVVFTPLHGVGALTAMEVLIEQGFRVVPVEEQMRPDGQFPNVTQTPNPEVPESMDRAVALAARENADLVLATDPDADRLGAEVPEAGGGEGEKERRREGEKERKREGEKERARDWATRRGGDAANGDAARSWRFLTGNEIAALVTHFKLAQLTAQGGLPRSPIVIKTLVTTSVITRIARHFNVQIVENLLVGFKYIAEVLWQLEQTGAYEDVRGTPEDFVIACEESHGILVTPHIRDKDAAGGALLLAELALDQKRRGRSLLDYLEDLTRRFGYFRNEVLPLVMPGILGKKNIDRVMEHWRSSPPREIAGLPVTGFEDLRDEHGRLGPVKGATDYASRNVVVFRLGDRGRVALRPSGTEPKAKAYVEILSSPCPPGATSEEWRCSCQEVDELTSKVATDFIGKCLQVVGLPMPADGIRLSR